MKPSRHSLDRIGIVGAGITGRMLAWQLLRAGFKVEIFERLPAAQQSSCSYAAAGMLAPFSELMHAEPLLVTLGVQALTQWRQIRTELELTSAIQFGGTLVIAQPSNHESAVTELQTFHARLLANIAATPNWTEKIVLAQREKVASLCPGLEESSQQGIHLVDEGWLIPQKILTALEQKLAIAGTEIQFASEVLAIKPHQLLTRSGPRFFDVVVDCRGLAARDALPGLRGVRGESVLLSTPELDLKVALRVLHHRYPLYVVPRRSGEVIVGASSIENEDAGPITLKSLFELLAPLFQLHPAFHYARLLQQYTGVRPALADHLPCIERQAGLLRVNGLYRHGFLLAPVMAQIVIDVLMDRVMRYPTIVRPFMAQ